MFTTFDGRHRSISHIISEKVSSHTAAQLDCATIHKILGPRRDESKVTHLTCGKLLHSHTDAPGLSIIGKQVTRLPVPVSPRTHRVNRLKLQSLNSRMFEKNGDERIHTPPEGLDRLHAVVEKNQYPSWSGFLDGLEGKLIDNVNKKKLMEELEKFWAVWNSDFNTSFNEIGESQYFKQKHIAFDGWPPWRHCESYSFGTKTEVLDRRNIVHLAVTKNFYTKFHDQLIFDWKQYVSAPQGISLSLLELEIDLFIRKAVKITRTDWPLEICEILLQNTNHWVSCISDTKTSSDFFGSIAALQTTLLRKIVLKNIETFGDAIHRISQTNRLKIVLSEAEVDTHALWSLTCRFEELVQEILRVEHRLFPDLFTEKKYLIIEKVTPENDHPLLLQTANPFLASLKEMNEVRDATMAIIDASDSTSANFIEMHTKIINLRQKIRKICPKIFTDLFQFDFSPCLDEIVDKLNMLLEALRQKVNEFISEHAKVLTDYYNLSSKKLYGQKPFAQLHNLVNVQGEDVKTLASMFKKATLACSPLLNIFDINELTLLRYYQAARTEKRLAYLAKLIWDRLQVDRDALEKAIIERSSAVFYECEMLEREVKQSIKRYKLYQKSAVHVRMMAKRFEEMANTLEKLAEEAPILNNQLGLLGLEPLAIDVTTLAEKCQIFADVSAVHAETIACEELYMNAKVQDVNCDEISVQLTNLSSRFNRINSFVFAKTDDVLVKDTLAQLIPTIETVVKTFNEALPLIKALRAEGMKERHWENILNEANATNQMHERLLIKDLVTLDLNKKAVKYEEVSIIAGKELQLEATIDKIKQFWNEAEMKFKLVREDYEFDLPPDLPCILDEHIIQLSMTLASPFASNFATVLKELLAKLQSLQRIFGLYQTCHTKFVYLEPLFTTEDIAYQMPDEWRIYQAATSSWQFLNNEFQRAKKYMPMLELGFEEKFNQIFDKFKTIQIGFDAYLRKKKLHSPRLHFLSNTELLEMLSKARTPALVEPFLPKLFTSIAVPQFNSRGEIATVFAADGEQLDFHRPVNVNLAKRRIEKWLLEMEREMKHTIQICVQKTLNQFQYELVSLERILKLGYVAQVVLLYYRITITYMIEEAIENEALTVVQSEIKLFIDKVKTFPASNPREILLIDNLLVDLDVTQDCLVELIAKDVKSIHSVIWQSRFRHYWSNENVFIRVYNVHILYGYEYLSLTKPFVRTEKVKALHVQLAIFQHQKFACLLQGPAATGKSETIKEFSRILGRCCISFNCSSQTPQNQLESLIAGALLSGATLCLDEFNRLSGPVMTAVINHFIGIYQALLVGSSNAFYRLNGLELVVNPQAAFFLTMNPKYVGRSALPTNTTAVAKIIDVATADLEAIAHEYFLLAQCKAAKQCASVLTSTFKQCSSIVSPMRHYDFNLRTVLTTVRSAIWFKSTQKTVTEASATMKATQSVLSSIFTADDSRIFTKILMMSKSKPMITDAETAYKTAIVGICERLNLVPTENFVNMTYNLYFLCRHHCALILVGCTLSAKSTCLKVARILTKEKDNIHCEITTVCPSIHTNEALFGRFDSQKLEWRRGILTRALAESIGQDEEHWVHIDGVIDSLWVETLNSLLDDNRKLNLGNGETVLLNDQIRIIFETSDLKNVASSTISRCRVLFFDEKLLDATVLGSTLVPLISETTNSITTLSTTVKKLMLHRICELYRLHEAFPQNDLRLAYLLTAISTLTVLPSQSVPAWLDANQKFIPALHYAQLFDSFPQAFGQWMDLSTETDYSIRFWRMFLKRLFRSSMMLTIFGKSGTGKSRFIQGLVETLNTDNWDVHVLSLAETTTAESLLQAILSCNLVRIHTNHFTGPNAKNVLIILDGLNRLRLDESFNSAFEVLRSFHATSKIMDNDGNELQFTSVHFLAEFSTFIEDPQKLNLPERLFKYILPWHWKATDYSNPENACNGFLALAETDTTEDSCYRDCLISELHTAAGQLSELNNFADYLNIVKNLHTSIFSHVGNQYLTNFGFESWEITGLPEIRQKLLQHIEKESPRHSTVSPYPTHRYAIRHWMFLHKLLEMPADGHCLFVGSSLNQFSNICKLATSILDVHFEELPVELTRLRWRETLSKIARLSALENRKILLLITDAIYEETVFKDVLTDLVVTMNCGALPPSLFSAQLLAEFREKKLTNTNTNNNIATQKDMSEWRQKEAIGSAIRTHLHVIFRTERNTVTKFASQFEQLKNYALVADLDSWSDAELLDFAKHELQKSRLFADNQPEVLGQALMNAFKFAKSKLKNKNGLSSQQFLVFVKEYIHLVERKRASLELLDKRYKTGILKLVKANEQMQFLKQELLRLQPELVRTSLETTALMSSLERETIEIENAREVVAANEFKANEAATKAQALKAECEREVTDAIPALETAIDALQILNQNDISTLKTMRFPPQGVRLCMEAVCILLAEKPAKSVDQTGNVTIDYWPTSQKVLSDIHFLTRIRTFPRDRVSYKTMRLIRSQYLSKPEFDADVMKQVSLAAEGLCLWVKAIDIYNKIAKVVAPKKEKLKKAELMVKQHMKQLEHRRKALQEVTERLQRLSDQFSHMSQRKQELQNQIQSCETRMTRAEKLTSSLENERKRWDDNLKLLKIEGNVYKHNALLAASYIHLLDNIDAAAGMKLISDLQQLLRFETNDNFDVKSLLQHNSILLDGSCASSDYDPYVILELTTQTPLIVDPQGESGRILRRLIPGTLITTDMHSTSLATDIAAAIGNGHTLIVDNLCEPLPLCLMQLICPKFINDSQQTSIQIESHLFPYCHHFRLILRTESASFSNLLLQYFCVINVAVGEHIVRDKLMDIFVCVNAFPLTRKMDQLIEEKTKLIRQTDLMEDQILENLVKSKDLEDDRCIDMLIEIRGLAATMNEKDAELDVIRVQLNELKDKFVEIGEYGTRLINASLNVTKLSSFYKRTLRFYLDVFQMSVAIPSEKISENCINEIKKNVLNSFRFKVSRSLFAEHRRVFEFLISESIPLKELSKTSTTTFAKHFSKLHSERNTNLRDQILYAESTLPIVLLLSRQSDYVIRMLFSIAEFTGSSTSPASTSHGRNRSVQLVSSEEFLDSNWLQILDNDQWLIVLNCETLDASKLENVIKLAQTILSSDVRKSSFRLFFVVYPDNELASHSLFDISTVITVDDSRLTFSAFISYCYTSLGPSRTHSTLQLSLLRKQLYKLCCFHFAVLQRTQFDIFGFANRFNVSLANLECAVKLFEGTIPLTPTPTFDAIWTCVIDIAYTTSDPVDRKTLRGLGRWIFEGVNKFDDRALDNVWPKEYNQSLGMFKIAITELKSINDWVLSGLGRAVVDAWQLVKFRRTQENIVAFVTNNETKIEKDVYLPTEMMITNTVASGDGKASIEQCLWHELQFLEENNIFQHRKVYIETLLANSPIQEIALFHTERPEAIVETLKFMYAKSLRTGFEEVETIGVIRRSISNDAIKLVDVYLLGATLKPDTNVLIDSTEAYVKIYNLQIVARRKATRSPATIHVPLLYKSQLDSTKWRHIVDVEIESPLPESHWLLLGVKFVTCENCVEQLSAK